jgi:serine/threonine protein kinase
MLYCLGMQSEAVFGGSLVDTDRNLLFGVLALQADLIDAAQFAEVCTAWTARKDSSLSDLLQERGWLTDSDKAILDLLIARKLTRHGGDVHASLAAAADRDVQRVLAALKDSDIERTLSALARPNPSILVSTVNYLPDTCERYKLTRLHAQGGIGRVWLARDSSLGREVALKELRPERAQHPALWSRFLHEAMITGQLEHPGIVPVYELARRDRDQQPFYTMRFVKGRTLADAIRALYQNQGSGPADALEQRALLNAFVGVCNAVAYAHARGVVHRDLKSSNVVLGDFGEVIVLDWGLAKIVGRDGGDIETPAIVLDAGIAREDTLAGQVLGTPAYMAPEQASGQLELVDQRTDIYGLGAILYEVLTGQPPFAGADTQEVLRKVCSEAPIRPRAVIPTAPAALEAVCLRALAKSRSDRYASAGDLAGEVRRWMADEPVQAYREPWLARVSRWTRRRKALVTSAAALLLLSTVGLAAGTVLISQEKARADEARVRAEENFRLARDAVDRYYTHVSESKLLNVPHLQPLRKDLLESARQFYEEFARKRGDDSNVKADLATAYLRLAEITSEIGSKLDAIDIASKALALFEKLMAVDRANADYLRGAAWCSTSLGLWYDGTGQTELAEKALLKGLGLQHELTRSHPAAPRYQGDLAVSEQRLGALYRKLGRIGQAEQSYQRGREALDRLVHDYPDVPEYQHKLAMLSNHLGYIYAETQRTSQAEELFHKARRIEEELVAAHAEIPEHQRYLAAIHNDLGFLYAMAQQAEKSEAAYHNALAVYEKLTRDFPDVADYLSQRAKTYLNLGTLMGSLGRRSDELQAIKGSLAIYQELAQDHPDVPDYQAELAKCWNNLAVVHHVANDTEPAADAYRRALSLWQPLSEKYPDIPQYQRLAATAQFNLGILFRDTNRIDQAETHFQEALAVRLRLLRDSAASSDLRRDVRSSLHELGILQSRVRKKSEAENSFRVALEIAERLVHDNSGVPDDQRNLAAIENSLATLYVDLLRFEEAETLTHKALAAQQRLMKQYPNVPDYQNDVVQSHRTLAAICLQLSETDRARPEIHQARTILERLRQDYPDVSDYIVQLGATYLQLSQAECLAKPDQAIQWASRAITRLEPIVEKGTQFLALETLAHAYAIRADCASKLGRHEDAQQDWDRAMAFDMPALRLAFRLGRAASWARQGNHVRSIAEAGVIEQEYEANRGNRQGDDDPGYRLACVYALAASAAEQDQQLPRDEHDRLAAQYAARAVRLLNEACERGLLKVPADVKRLSSDPDFASLRNGDAFQELLGNLNLKSNLD